MIDIGKDLIMAKYKVNCSAIVSGVIHGYVIIEAYSEKEAQDIVEDNPDLIKWNTNNTEVCNFFEVKAVKKLNA